MLGKILLVNVAIYCVRASSSARCKEVTENRAKEACDVLPGLEWKVEPSELIPCGTGNDDTEKACLAQECCWFKSGCYKKPKKCYADFRIEQCPTRNGWRPTTIYTGYTLNGSYCFIESVTSYTSRYTFEGATSFKGVRILEDNADPCVTYRETNTTKIAPGMCNVRDIQKREDMNGTIHSNKCVVSVLTTGLVDVVDFGHRHHCVCKLNAWKAYESDASGVSQEIRDIVLLEESKSSCSRILGRLLRNSWRSRVDIVNKDEADVVVRALINITEKTSSSLDIQDVRILLDTSDQLSKYKFYDGLDNHSADLLIKSSTKYVSNLLKSVVIQKGNSGDVSQRPKRSVELGGSPTRPDDSEVIRWKIMKNLEDIAENIVALMEAQKNSSYIVEAKEEAVDLRVAVTKNDLVDPVIDANSAAINLADSHWSATVKNISDAIQLQDSSVAVVTAFYNLSRKSLVSNIASYDVSRTSGILAINPRVLKGGLVGDRLSLPVVFTLPVRDNLTHVNAPSYLCSYQEDISGDLGLEWRQTGCQVKDWSDSTVTCECTHTTHFAVLLQLHYEGDKIPERHTDALEYLSIVTGSLSVAALAVTLIVFIYYRQILLTHRTAIHLNLAIALMGGYSSLLLGSIFSSRHLDHPKACFGLALTAHLFFLSTFCWFLMEGIYLFYKVVMVFSSRLGEYGAKYAPVLGWGLPALIVIASVLGSRNLNNDQDSAIHGDAYYDARTCFLQTSNGMQWTFLAPAFFIIIINICVLMKVVSVIFQSSRSSSTKGKSLTNSVRASAKGTIILLPILGVPWIFNIFTSLPAPAGLVAAYIHVVLMGLQGVAIFLFYCVFNSEVRKAFKLSSDRRKSLASIDTANKNRKRSQVPLVCSNTDSPPIGRYKNSLSSTATSKMYTLTSQMSHQSEPPSPNSSISGMKHLSPLDEISPS